MVEKIRKNTTLLIITFFILILFNGSQNFNVLPSVDPNKGENTKSILKSSEVLPPIKIFDSDPTKNWSYTASHYNWCYGSGTWSDPYIIENVTVNGEADECIHISSYNVYFIIRNCTLFNGSLYLSANNGTIFKNSCSTYGTGGAAIYLWYCINITIIDNELQLFSDPTFPFKDNYGIILDFFCENITIMGNTINNNEDKGIGIDIDYSCYNVSISENSLFRCGLIVEGGTYENFITYFVEPSNLVNNKKLYYYVNKNNLKSPDFLNSGQIILIRCNDSIISNLDVTHSTLGIFLFECKNVLISKNIVSFNRYPGIYVAFSNNISLINNIFNDCPGIYLLQGNNNLLKENFIESGIIWIYYSNNNIVSENRISDGSYGIKLDYSYSNTISGNIIRNTEFAGIYLDYSNYTTIFANIIKNSNETGLYIHYSQENVVYQNCFIENRINAEDDGILNQWDNGTVGNYWDNYEGVDDNNDGIGDTPYDISGSAGSKDNYPLMSCDLIGAKEDGIISGSGILFIILISGFISMVIFIIRRKRFVTI